MFINASRSRLLKRSDEICRVCPSPVIRCFQSKIFYPRQNLDEAQTMPRSVVKASSSSSVPSNSHAGHAFLHDFCMSLPYAAISIIAAIALTVLGSKQTAAPAIALAIGGTTVAIASILSLKKWKADQSSSVLTLLIGGISGYLGYTCWGSFQSGLFQWLTGSMSVLSAALALFAFYNVAAGGNPPKKR